MKKKTVKRFVVGTLTVALALSLAVSASALGPQEYGEAQSGEAISWQKDGPFGQPPEQAGVFNDRQPGMMQGMNDMSRPDRPMGNIEEPPELPEGEEGMTPPERPDGEKGTTPPERPDGEDDMTPPERPDSKEGMTPPERPDGEEGMTPPERPDGEDDMTPPELPGDAPEVPDGAEQIDGGRMQQLFRAFLDWLNNFFQKQ